MNRFKDDVFQILESSLVQEKTDVTHLLAELDHLKDKVVSVETKIDSNTAQNLLTHANINEQHSRNNENFNPQ